MADRLEIYKAVLRLVGNASGLSSLTEVNPARRIIDDVWRPAVEYVLSKGMWNHAIRASEFSNDENVQPRFGYSYAISKPDDWVRTVSISNDETFSRSNENYDDETNYWYVNANPVYIRFVSNLPEYGWNVGAWRAPFTKALEAYIAFESGLPISNDKMTRNDMFQLFKTRLAEAKTLDAVDERVRFRPTGKLVMSRQTSFGTGKNG
jgi:hypothetical protein